jgi:hypothetical protein
MLYGIDEVERVDELIGDLDRNDDAWSVHHAVAAAWGSKTRHLIEQRENVLRRLRGTSPAPELDVKHFMSWPGMPNYRNPVS